MKEYVISFDKEKDKEEFKKLLLDPEQFEVRYSNNTSYRKSVWQSNSLKLFAEDLKNTLSPTFRLVYIPWYLNHNREPSIDSLADFAVQFNNKLFEAMQSHAYGDHGTVWAAWTYIGGRQAYFKFTCPDEAGLNNGDLLHGTSWEVLNDYILPFYYKEFGSPWSYGIAYDPKVKAWDTFELGID